MADSPLNDPFLKGSPITKLLGGTTRPHKVFRISGRLEGYDLAVRAISVEETEIAHAEAIKRIHEGESVSSLFDGVDPTHAPPRQRSLFDRVRS
mgnify:CR=1 FL=1